MIGGRGVVGRVRDSGKVVLVGGRSQSRRQGGKRAHLCPLALSIRCRSMVGAAMIHIFRQSRDTDRTRWAMEESGTVVTVLKFGVAWMIAQM